MAGATPEFIELDHNNAVEGITPQGVELAEQQAAANADLYASAFFGDDWREDPDDAAAADNATHINALNLERYLTTYGSDEYPNSNSVNLEAYTESWSDQVTLVGWANQTGSSDDVYASFYEQAAAGYGADAIVIGYTGIRSNNAAKNLYGEDSTYSRDNGRVFYAVAVLTPDVDHLVVSSITSSDDPIASLNS